MSITIDNDLVNRQMAAIIGAADLAKRLDAFRQVFEKFDRIMADFPVKVVITPHPDLDAPAWTDGETVWINAVRLGMLDGKPLTGIVAAAKALNLHELCHVLYTPRRSSDLTKWVLEHVNEHPHDWSFYVKQAWNILEDQRIETMFAGMYRPAGAYFEANVMTWMLERTPEEIGGFFPIIYGRRFLPKATIEKVEKEWLRDHSWVVTKKFRSIIDSYLKIVYPQGTADGIKLITRFAKLLCQEAPKTPMMAGIPMAASEHPDDMLDKGKPNEKAQRDAQERMGNLKRRPTKRNDQGDDPIDPQTAAGDGEGDDEGKGDGMGKADAPGAPGGDQEANDGDPGEDGDDGKGTDAGTGASDPIETVKELEGILDDLVHDGNFAADLDRTVNAVAEAMAEVELTAVGPTAPGTTEQVDGKTRATAELMMDTLRQLRTEMEETHVNRITSGKLDGRRFASRQPWDIDFFKLWTPGERENSDIEAVIVVDQSISMEHSTRNTARALWATKYALEQMSARVTVLGFSDHGYVLYAPEDKAIGTSMRVFYTHGGTVPDTAIAQAHRIMHASKRSIKVLLTITDGDWQGDVPKTERYITSMANDGVITALAYIGGRADPNDAWFQKHRHEHMIFKAVNDVSEMTPLALMIVEQAMQSMIDGMRTEIS